MWLNTKAVREQVLMNHWQPQDWRAPASHITLTIIIIIIIPFPFALSFSDSLAVAKTKTCYLRSHQHAQAEGLPTGFPQQASYLVSATGVSIPSQTGTEKFCSEWG